MSYLGIRFIQKHAEKHEYTLSPKTYLFNLTLGQLKEFQNEKSLSQNLLWVKVKTNPDKANKIAYQPAIAVELNTNPGRLDLSPITYVITNKTYQDLIHATNNQANLANNILATDKTTYRHLRHFLGHAYAHQVGPLIKHQQQTGKTSFEDGE